MTRIALTTSLLCILAPLAIPFTSGVPFSLSTLVIMATSILLGPKQATLSILLYLLIGCFGLPVFSNYQAGPSVLLEPTGGFLLGYLFLAFFTSFFLHPTKPIQTLLSGLLLGNSILYLFGCVWFSLVMHASLSQVFIVCVLPFLVTDSIKIALILVCSPFLIRLKKY